MDTRTSWERKINYAVVACWVVVTALLLVLSHCGGWGGSPDFP